MRRGPRPRALAPIASPAAKTDRAALAFAVTRLVNRTLADWLESGRVVIVQENGKRKVKVNPHP